MSKNFRNRKRKHNKKLPARYTLLIMTAVCFVTMLLSLTLNISGGPLKTAAGYVFIPMQKGINSFGIHISDKITEIRTLKNVKAENKKLKAEVEELTTQLTTTKIIASIGNNTYKSASRKHIHAYVHSILFSFVDSKGRKPVSAVLCYNTGSDLGI